jgi:hypothetical protein
MRAVMNYEAEFPREEATTSASALSEALMAVRVEWGTWHHFDPTPMLDRPGGHGRPTKSITWANAPANAQAGAKPAAPDKDASTASEPHDVGSTKGPTADDVCHALE